MKTKLTFGYGLIAVITMLAFAACDDGSGGGGDDNKGRIPAELVGEWAAKSDSSEMIFKITSDGTFTSTGQSGGNFDKISVPGKTVEIKTQGVTVAAFDYSISGGEMTMTNATGFMATIAIFSPFVKIGGSNPGGGDPVDPIGPSQGYTVRFNANGGIGSIEPKRANPGGSVYLDWHELYRDGYTFTGWNTNASGTGTYYAPNSEFTPTGNITLYAMWTVGDYVTIYVVSFNANGGNGAVPGTVPVQAGSSITLPGGGGLSKVGYAFGGWRDSEYDYGTVYSAGESFTPSGYYYDNTITLYAVWYDASVFTIIFNLNGGSGTAPNTQTVNAGYSAILPGNLTLEYAAFTGWNTKADGSGTSYTSTITPTGNSPVITLYAQWNITPVSSVEGLGEKLKWLKVHAKTGGSYTLEVDADESFYDSDNTLSYSGRNNITITLRGVGANRHIETYYSSDPIFIVESGVTLVLDNNISLWGKNRTRANVRELARVNSGGTLRMNNGSAITGNTATASESGGGVYVGYGGTFAMTGGEISDNTVTSYGSGGGGVYIAGGTFTMSGGTISGNAGARNYSSGGGGGVYVGYESDYWTGYRYGTFTMTGGTISGNTADNGGGVCMAGGYGQNGWEGGTFAMNGGTITGNTASSEGGGVSGHFTMSNGTISGNTASRGGGVHGSLTMTGGTISGNTATFNSYSGGGGVYVSGTLNKTGGTITGYASDTANGNVVRDQDGNVLSGYGHAVYASYGELAIRKETTAGTGVNLYFHEGQFSGSWD